MEASRTIWPDSRLDDLKESVSVIDGKVTRLDKKVDDGFARLDKKVDGGFARLDKKVDDGFARLDKKVDDGFARFDDRIDKLHHSVIAAFVALISIIAVLLTGFLTVVVTHL